ncbi:MAG TPA: CopD family protein [Gemmatimonadales bacterium]|nr:CopD family protein [Gemmatimonadales bacterium]
MSDLLGPAYAAARWGWYLAAFMVLGASGFAPFLFRNTPLPPRLRGVFPQVAADLSRRAARIGGLGAVALLGFGLVRLWLQTVSLLDPGEPVTLEFLGTVLGTGWGRGWAVQGGAALAALAGFSMARSGSQAGWLLAGLAALLTAAGTGMTGHAATAEAGRLGWLLDALHVGLGGLWLGGLAVMVLAGIPACNRLESDRQPTAIRLLVADFSRRARLAAPVGIGLGIGLAARYLGWGWPLRFTASSYGWVLAGKVAAVAGLAAIGAYNWKVLQPRVGEPGGGGGPRLRRSGLLELGFGLLVLLLTGILVALPFSEEM